MHDNPQSADQQQPYFSDAFHQLGAELFVSRVIATLAKEGASLMQEGEPPSRMAMGTSLLEMAFQLNDKLLEFQSHKLHNRQPEIAVSLRGE